MKKAIGILGGGLAGLSTAYFLDKSAYNVTILEKEAKCGGLLRAFVHEGFHFEFGGHILFSKDQEILEFILSMLGENKIQRYRNNKIYFKGRYIKYPFENELSKLALRDNLACLFYYLANKLKKKRLPKNFGEFLYYHFGKGITEQYLWPYNEKIWNINPALMSLEWAKDRLPLPPTRDVIKSSLGIKSEGYKHQLYFYYPRAGGVQALPDSFLAKNLEAGVKVITNFAVTGIRRQDGRYLVSGPDRELAFDQLVMAMPVHNFFKVWSEAPAAVTSALNNLRYNSLAVVMLGIKRDQLTDKFAVYFPDKSLVFHRVCFNKFLSESMCPPGTSVVQAEITTNPGDGVHDLSDHDLISQVTAGLARENIIKPEEVITAKVERTEYAYMVPQLDHEQNKKIVYDYFLSQNLPAVGRFAEFEYLNMDAVITHAKKLAATLNQAS